MRKKRRLCAIANNVHWSIIKQATSLLLVVVLFSIIDTEWAHHFESPEIRQLDYEGKDFIEMLILLDYRAYIKARETGKNIFMLPRRYQQLFTEEEIRQSIIDFHQEEIQKQTKQE